MPIGFKATSISDIEQGAEDALEEDIANLSPASNSVAANLDGGVAAVDWASKTPKVSVGVTSTFSVSGSGYLVTMVTQNAGDRIRASGTNGIEVDGETIVASGVDVTAGSAWVPFFRFESSFTMNDPYQATTISYILD